MVRLHMGKVSDSENENEIESERVGESGSATGNYYVCKDSLLGVHVCEATRGQVTYGHG